MVAIENKILWRYGDIYYETEDEALSVLMRNNPNASIGKLCDLAEDEILEVYNVERVENDLSQED